jgi:hypothetical protein
VVTELPKSAVGKVLRRKLVELDPQDKQGHQPVEEKSAAS